MKIGVFLPLIADADTQQNSSYRDIRAFTQQAEAVGFDSVWFPDHFFFRRPDQPTQGVWEAWTIAAALAAVTERVEIGALVLCTVFRNPAVLAKMADTLDEVSAGRLILGLGAGWHKPEFDAFGLPFDHLASRFEEAIQIIAPLLREGKVDFSGTYYDAPDCEIAPRGPRPAGPPLLFGASGPRMLRLTARYADAWNTCWHGRVSSIAKDRAAMEDACRAEGRDPATLEVTVGVNVTCPPRDDVAAKPVDPAKTLAGSADEVAVALHEYEAAGVGHVIALLDKADVTGLMWFADVLRAYRSGKL